MEREKEARENIFPCLLGEKMGGFWDKFVFPLYPLHSFSLVTVLGSFSLLKRPIFFSSLLSIHITCFLFLHSVYALLLLFLSFCTNNSLFYLAGLFLTFSFFFFSFWTIKFDFEPQCLSFTLCQILGLFLISDYCQSMLQ